MPKAVAAVNGFKNMGCAYVDRDKPAQIRFSNISAGKGERKSDILLKAVRNTRRGLVLVHLCSPSHIVEHETIQVLDRYKHDRIISANMASSDEEYDAMTSYVLIIPMHARVRPYKVWSSL